MVNDVNTNEFWRLQDFVTVNGNEYLVSTIDIYILGWETMVFRSIGDQTVIDYGEISEYTRRYQSQKEAEQGHIETIKILRRIGQ